MSIDKRAPLPFRLARKALRAPAGAVRTLRRNAANRMGPGQPTSRVIDAFLFFNEIDLLEARFRYMYDHVAKFVVVEALETFTGGTKPSYFLDHRERFAPFLDKVTHVLLDSIPAAAAEDNPMNPGTPTSEFWQRNQIMRGLSSCGPTDMVIISDVDEFPNILRLAACERLVSTEAFVSLEQSWMVFWLNALMDSPWSGSAAIQFKRLNSQFGGEPNRIWSTRWYPSDKAVIYDGGWHLSFMGGAQAIIDKMAACGHANLRSGFLDALDRRQFAGHEFSFHSNLPPLSRGLPESWVGSNDALDSLVAELRTATRTQASGVTP